MATVLMLAASVAPNLYVSNIGHYDEVYWQLGAVVVLMLWLYLARGSWCSSGWR
jgi:uncharacterized BrkB/YihY/UPF0761 family membrane protein